MNLNYVLMGSDMNPLYLDFWPIVSKVWNEILGIKPVLGLICDEDSDLFEDSYGLVKKFKKLDNIDVGLQSQIVRFFLPNFLEGNCMISDIDMLPLSKKYFEESSSILQKDNLIIFSSDNPECVKNQMYPMCYVAANSELFKKVFDIGLSWKDFCILLNERKESWYTDQKYLYQKVTEFNKNSNNVIFLQRGWNKLADRRIDRANWIYEAEKIKSDYYIDSHLLRPMKEHEHEIKSLINLL